MAATLDRVRWQRLSAILDQVIELEPEARARYIAEACRGDTTLRIDLEELLAAAAAPDDFLARPAAEQAGPLITNVVTLQSGSEFCGTERFCVRRRLGVGGMGAVYEVHDRARDEIVALKTLLRPGGANIYRLKREFRGLADVAHVNLVSLYDLFVEGDCCFFTMELVYGVNFVEYVRGASAQPSPCPGSGPRGHADRARSAFRQLVNGVSELHRVGKLHRDIKPSNVLVTPEGRVVVLDFGLITELVTQSIVGRETMAGGTPAYMAPEEGSAAVLTEASDWYSVGATLYEALTGRVPFEGPFFDVLQHKRESDPPAPADVAPDVPHDLSAVCMGLLCRDPAGRLSGREALLGLGAGGISIAEASRKSAHSRETLFVGREPQLNALNDAFRAVTSGRTALVSVCGPSGIGKSALVRRFLNDLKRRQEVVVLAGRCYEHESMPYKALDGVVDNLSRYLRSLPPASVAGLMPRDAATLSRLFPVMREVEVLVNTRRQAEPEIADPSMLRRRGFAALRELLARIADRQPLVIHIDDFHWADADSSVLLEEVIRSPSPPRVLLVVCFRSEEVQFKPFLQTLLARARSEPWSALQLEPLTEAEACELFGALIPAEWPRNRDDGLKIAREAGGNPFLVEQLAHYWAENGVGTEQGPTFQEMFEGRLRRLPAGAWPFLETLALSGRPVAPELVYEASGLRGDERPLVALLRSDKLVRSSGSSERIEIYHDRIRETLAAQIAPEATRRIHGLMAQALMARRSDDAEALFEHYRGAGHDEQASMQAGAAAEKANTALAFEKAARFYRHALELAPKSAACLTLTWKRGLAGALANAGRPKEAAEAYLEAAKEAGPSERVELQRRAAEQFLVGGHIDPGLEIVRVVLGSVGLRLARAPRTALASLLWRHAQLRWRGFDFARREAAQIAAEHLLRIDTCWSVMTGLALVDTIRASVFSARHLLLALEAGEPYRVARGLAMEAGFAAVAGGRSRSRVTQLLHRSQALSETVGHPHARALSVMVAGHAAYQFGQWKKSVDLFGQALGIFRERCAGVTWELSYTQISLLRALLYLGELREVSQQLPILLANAQDSGNLYLETELRTRIMNFVCLATDAASDGEQQAIESVEAWRHKGFQAARSWHDGMLARVQSQLYRGNASAAWRLIVECESQVWRTLFLRIQVFRIEVLYLRACCALAVAAGESDVHRFLSIAQDGARRIQREGMPWSDPLALLLRAAVMYLKGNPRSAAEQLADASDRFELADMHLHAAVVRRRLGALLGGAGGREMQHRAEEWMFAQNIRNPAFMSRMIAPGFPDMP